MSTATSAKSSTRCATALGRSGADIRRESRRPPDRQCRFGHLQPVGIPSGGVKSLGLNVRSSHTTPVRSARHRFASPRSAPPRYARRRFALVRFVSPKFALPRPASLRFAPVRFALTNLAPTRFA